MAHGTRKVQMFRWALVALCVAFASAVGAKREATEVLFSSFSTALGALLLAAVTGNVGEHFAKRGDDK